MQGHICRQVSESSQLLYFTIIKQKLAFKVFKVFSELWSLKHKERQGRCRLLLPSRETVEGERLDRHVLWKVHRLHLTRYWTKKDLLSIVKVCKGNLSTWPHHTWWILWDVRVRWQIKLEKSSFSFQFWKVRVKTSLYFLWFMVYFFFDMSPVHNFLSLDREFLCTRLETSTPPKSSVVLVWGNEEGAQEGDRRDCCSHRIHSLRKGAWLCRRVHKVFRNQKRKKY